MIEYDPPLRPGDEGYIAPANPSELECDSFSKAPDDLTTGPWGYLCCLAAGHNGDHAAHGTKPPTICHLATRKG